MTTYNVQLENGTATLHLDTSTMDAGDYNIETMYNETTDYNEQRQNSSLIIKNSIIVDCTDITQFLSDSTITTSDGYVTSQNGQYVHAPLIQLIPGMKIEATFKTVNARPGIYLRGTPNLFIYVGIYQTRIEEVQSRTIHTSGYSITGSYEEIQFSWTILDDRRIRFTTSTGADYTTSQSYTQEQLENMSVMFQEFGSGSVTITSLRFVEL